LCHARDETASVRMCNAVAVVVNRSSRAFAGGAAVEVAACVRTDVGARRCRRTHTSARTGMIFSILTTAGAANMDAPPIKNARRGRIMSHSPSISARTRGSSIRDTPWRAPGTRAARPPP
jgi:hypothetical protein